MKRKEIYIIIFMYLFMNFVVVYADDNIEGEQKILQQAQMSYENEKNQITEAEILSDYKLFINKPELETKKILYQIYGTYDDYTILWISDHGEIGTDNIVEIYLGNYVFVFGSGSSASKLYVYKDNSFIPIKEAYDSNIITDDVIEYIAKDFDIPGYGGVSVYKVKQTYKDVSEEDWFFSYTSEVLQNNLMTGIRENIFGPYEILSRAQFTTILSRMEEIQSVSYEDTFEDVAEEEWYTDAVLWATENKIVTGYENGYFGPADYITREQMAVMLYRYAEYKGYNTEECADLIDYPDVSDVSDFANDAMSWCVAKGIISGNDGKLLPQGNTSRAECAAMISRFINLYE